MNSEYSPVTLFVYNRPEHTQQVIDALRENYLARDSELIIFSDAPKDIGERDDVEQVRSYIKSIEGFKKLIVIERDSHFGLSRSIISGVTEVIRRYGKIIVLEDDLVTSPHFLEFMNDALCLYEHEERVISVCGYMYPISNMYTGTLFLRVADCWGWATWKRGWDLFEPDGKKLLIELRDKKVVREFNLDGAFNYSGLLRQQIKGKRDSWSIRWFASAFLNGKLTLFPTKSLVKNIGFDNTGTHRGFINGYDARISQEAIPVISMPVQENEEVVNAIKGFHKRRKLRFISQSCFSLYQSVKKSISCELHS